MALYPRARKTELVIEELPSETIVYDLACHRAHCLNKTATLIWKCCDGQTSVEGLANRLSESTGLPPDPDVVRLGLHALSDSFLLVDGTSGGGAPTRRELTKRLAAFGAGAVAAIPVITSIVAPTRAMAGSGDDHGNGQGGQGNGRDNNQGNGQG